MPEKPAPGLFYSGADIQISKAIAPYYTGLVAAHISAAVNGTAVLYDSLAPFHPCYTDTASFFRLFTEISALRSRSTKTSLKNL